MHIKRTVNGSLVEAKQKRRLCREIAIVVATTDKISRKNVSLNAHWPLQLLSLLTS